MANSETYLSSIRKENIMKTLNLIVIFMFLSSISYALDDPALVLYCPFEEGGGDTTTDQASGLVGTINGAEWTGDGKFGNALEFSAAGHFVEFPEDAVMDITDAVTMEAWVLPIQVQADSGVMGRRTAANAGGYCMQWTNAMVETWIHIGGWQGTRDKQAMQPDTGEWHHIAGVFTGSEIIQYVDGEIDSEFNQAGTMGSVAEIFRIGQAQTGLESMFGTIDEVAVYNRALSEAEIKMDMEAGVIPAAVTHSGNLATTWAAIRSR
jgi:hypothetical protein